MKMDTKWIRRSALLVLGACFVVGVTGCFDDDDDDIIPNFWEITWSGDETGLVPLTLPYTGNNLHDIPSGTETYGDYTLTITVADPNITVQLNDNTGPFVINLVGTITSSTAANGTYTGFKSDGTAFPQGTWSIYEK